MIELHTLIAFTLLNMSFALIPGPDVICILTNAITRGLRAGVLVCVGIACAALVHVGAASLGLTAFLQAVPTAFVVIKTVGAIYLAWLGWQMLTSPSELTPSSNARPWQSPFAQGAVSNLLNPKIALFFLAILPQFIDPQRDLWVQFAWLAATFVIVEAVVEFLIASLAHRVRPWLERSGKGFNRVCGTLFAAMGLALPLTR